MPRSRRFFLSVLQILIAMAVAILVLLLAAPADGLQHMCDSLSANSAATAELRFS